VAAARGELVRRGPDDDPEDGGAEDFEDVRTHLDDEAYEEFVRREMDGEGRRRDHPRVGIVLAVIGALVLALAVLVLR
jgi:hypothetical protein